MAKIELGLTMRRKQRNRKEQGAVIFLLVGVLLMLVGLVGVIAYEFQNLARSKRSLQRAADAMALAAALQLKPTLKPAPISGDPDIVVPQACMTPAPAPGQQSCQMRGWFRSKRAIFALLAANPIDGYPQALNISQVSTSYSGLNDVCEDPTSDYQRNTFAFPASGAPVIEISFLRGYSSGADDFLSIEQLSAGAGSGPGSSACLAVAKEYANAARVEITYTKNDTLFARLLGWTNITRINVVSLGVPDPS